MQHEPALTNEVNGEQAVEDETTTTVTAMDEEADGDEIEQEVQEEEVEEMWRGHTADDLLMASRERGCLLQVGCYPPLQIRRMKDDWGWILENVYVTLTSATVQ